MKYTYLSQAVVNIYGYTAEEILSGNKPFIEYYAPESRMVVQKIIGEKIGKYKSGESDNLNAVFEVQFIHKDGHYVWAEVSGSLIIDKEYNPIRLLGITRNIEERKKMEQAVKESEKKYRMLTENTYDLV
jgi:PAS domain S-box-containing protein